MNKIPSRGNPPTGFELAPVGDMVKFGYLYWSANYLLWKPVEHTVNMPVKEKDFGGIARPKGGINV